jgi:hypothetical protein
MIIPGGPSISSSIALLNSFAKAHPGAITSIEGPNEVNNWPVSYNGLTGVTGDVAFESALISAVHGSPTLSSIPVYNLTSWPDIGTAAPVANYHTYPTAGSEPYSFVAGGQAAQLAVMPGKSAVLTETGYYTVPNSANGVDDVTQAKLTLNLLMDATKVGDTQVYLYQLLDAYSDPTGSNPDDHYGLFDLSNDPKPAATAIHNLTTILSDPGKTAKTFTTTALHDTITGMTSADSSLQMEKSSGAHDIVVWSEPQIWNPTTHQEIAVAPHTVTVSLGAVYATVSVYDPLVGTTAVSTLHNVSSVQLGITDHPLIVEVGPTLGSVASVSTPVTTPGAHTQTTPTIAPVHLSASFASPLGLTDIFHMQGFLL